MNDQEDTIDGAQVESGGWVTVKLAGYSFKIPTDSRWRRVYVDPEPAQVKPSEGRSETPMEFEEV